MDDADQSRPVDGGVTRPAPAPVPRPAGMWLRLLAWRGVGLYVDPLVVALLAWILATRQGAGGPLAAAAPLAIVMGSVLLHEIGHAWMAHRRGLRVGGIFLHLVPFAYVERGAPADELRVALAGPLTNLALALGLAALFGVSGLVWSAPEAWLDDPRWTAIGINGLMGVLNLVPALPLDGGRALRAFLLQRMAPGRARARTGRVGTFVGAAVVVGAVALWTWPDSLALGVLGVFLCVVAWREAQQR